MYKKIFFFKKTDTRDTNDDRKISDKWNRIEYCRKTNYFGGIIFGLKRVEPIGLSVDKIFFFSSIETPGFNLDIGLKGIDQKNQ